MKKILVFTYLQRHFKKLIPIIQELNKNKAISVTVVLMTAEEKQLAEEYGIKYQMLDVFTQKPRQYNFDLDWGLEPLIHAIDFIKPDLFLAIEVNFILRNAIRYCKQQGITNLVVQHGTPNIYSLHAFAPFEGDCFAAWGEFTKDFLVSQGVNPQKIMITGGPVFDRTLTLQPKRELIAEQLNIDPEKEWIVFTTQGVGPGNRPSEEELFIAVTEIAKLSLTYNHHQFIYQVHPGQSIETIKEMVDTVSHNAVIAKYHDTEELIAASHGMITFFSTTAIDTVLLKKPLLLINLTDDGDFLPFSRMGAAFVAYSPEEIELSFKKFIESSYQLLPYQETAANYVNYLNDGHAGERVLKQIVTMLGLNQERGDSNDPR